MKSDLSKNNENNKHAFRDKREEVHPLNITKVSILSTISSALSNTFKNLPCPAIETRSNKNPNKKRNYA